MNVADTLGRWAEKTPFAVAIAERERLVVYRELDAAVWRIASRLSAAGLRPGDRVGLSLAGNSALYLATAYAVARLGAVLLLLPVTEPLALPKLQECWRWQIPSSGHPKRPSALRK